MNSSKKEQRYPVVFPVYYALIFMTLAVFTIFLPLYLNSLNFNKSEIGVLTAFGSIIALFAQPIWGYLSDRSRTKNGVLKILIFLGSTAILLFRMSTGYWYLFIVMLIFSFFQTPIIPISDAITLEYMHNTKWKFGPVRFAGTIGYALIAVIVGAFIKDNVDVIFFLSFVLGMITLITCFKIPTVSGHQLKGNGISIASLFKNRELMMLLAFTLPIHATISFYSAFFAIHYTNLGASNGLLGWAIFIASLSEVFFLFYGDKIINKLGIKKTLFGAGGFTLFRWLMMGVIKNIYVILFLQILHGFIFIVLAYSMATYINKEVPKELKASGQALNAVVSLGIAKIFGNIGGGFLSDIIGTSQVFLYSALIVLVSMILFGVIFLKPIYKNGR